MSMRQEKEGQQIFSNKIKINSDWIDLHSSWSLPRHTLKSPEDSTSSMVSNKPFLWGRPHLIAFCRHCVFYRLKLCGNCVSSRSIGTIFPTMSADFVSLSHFGNFCNIWHFFIIIVLLWWSVDSDLCCDHWKMMMTRWGLREWLAVFFSKYVFLT